LAGCIDRGLNQVASDLQTIEGHVATVQAIQETLEPTRGSRTLREQRFELLRDQLRSSDDLVQRQMGTVMASFQVGLFAGSDDPELPRDNLDLERWFRQPKGHERHIHGRKHAGVRIVQEGPTLVHALDAHLRHPGPLTAAVLLPYLRAQSPDSQQQAITRRKIARRARSRTKRPLLLAELEARYADSS
jgi:hypothetical protein